MLLNDRTEIGTLGCRLSPEQCECKLNNDKSNRSACIVKPVHISSKVSRAKTKFLGLFSAHYSSLARKTLC